jgi:hypothetical protein
VAGPESAALETGLLKRPRIEKYRISKIYNIKKLITSQQSSIKVPMNRKNAVSVRVGQDLSLII